MSDWPLVMPARILNGYLRLNRTRLREFIQRQDDCDLDLVLAPRGYMKTRLQEMGFHAMITPWAKDEGHRIDDLKRDLLRAVFGEQEHINPITGDVTMVLREPHTSTLSRSKYSELIERTLEIAAECGVVLQAPNEYRGRTGRQMRRLS